MMLNRPAEGNVGTCVGQRRFRGLFRESRVEHQGIDECLYAIEGPPGPGGPEAAVLRFGQASLSGASRCRKIALGVVHRFSLGQFLYTIYI
jgi:hypothetical protein